MLRAVDRDSLSFRAMLALLVGFPSAVLADIAAAPDITVDLTGVVVTDHQVAIDDLVGGIALETFGGSLPDGAEVDAYHDDGANGVLFSVDTTVSLPGGVVAGHEDVVRRNGGVFSLAFDGSAQGVPAGVGVDAVTRDAGGKLVLSFDTAVTLGGALREDEDLVGFDGANFTLALDVSAKGFDPALDTDAVAGGPDVWALSFDGHGVAGGVTFADEDVVRVSTSGSTVTMLFDASAEHAGWSNADLGALPEPGFLASLLSGATALAALATRKRTKARRSTSA